MTLESVVSTDQRLQALPPAELWRQGIRLVTVAATRGRTPVVVLVRVAKKSPQPQPLDQRSHFLRQTLGISTGCYKLLLWRLRRMLPLRVLIPVLRWCLRGHRIFCVAIVVPTVLIQNALVQMLYR